MGKKSNGWRSREVVNFTNILRATFAPISFQQKNTNLSRKSTKELHKTFLYEKDAPKTLVKLTQGCFKCVLIS